MVSSSSKIAAIILDRNPRVRRSQVEALQVGRRHGLAAAKDAIDEVQQQLAQVRDEAQQEVARVRDEVARLRA
jgi:hypothetical protein